MRIFGKGEFIWWIGVVENRRDPLQLGRVQVRIYGYHSDDLTVLPRDDLPWAVPIQPITSAAISGIGSAPLGPVEGTWVVGFFLDGEDMQQPAIFGTIATSAAKGFPGTPSKDPVTNANDGVLKDGNGNPVKDSSGNDVLAGTPKVEGWELGKTSEKYESGGRGPGTINDYRGSAKGDYGGASYGTYQLASFLPEVNEATGKNRPSAKNSPVAMFVKMSKFATQFQGLTPATSEFDSKWREISSSQTQAFKDEQHRYIKENYYDVMVANLARRGLALGKFGPAVQDLIWSTAVQLGPNATEVFTTPLADKSDLTDKDIVDLVSEYKINSVDRLFKSSSANIRSGVKTRYAAEKTDLNSLIRA